ncbi:hypothetical protein DSO57_1010802 [Entomophthora muscae]|uniref:Uncharacterized protein n=2 Tax=Entomophthora muscae TaxID=34485 RepID=A0ACC2RL88_9FUNG|nr:hypothetical protein DSO57_1010801 [Entomophthora muscae]KAJ9050802.1 hypothetical protein DSO57_1010802 [Entomophthora muscae]
MKFTSILIFATALVSSSPLFSSKAPQDNKYVAKQTQNPRSEHNNGPLCGQGDDKCLRMFGLGKLLSGGRFGPKVLGKKVLNKASETARSLKSMIATRNLRMDV